MEELVGLFVKTFRLQSSGCPWGSCTDDFLFDRAIEVVESSDISVEDKWGLTEMFKKNMYHSMGRFSNGKHAGLWYISIVKEYYALKERVDI